MKKVFLFCQAPGEVNNLLSSYEVMLKRGYFITIVCLKLKTLKLFLDELNLEAKIVLFSEAPISLKSPILWFKKNRIVKENLNKIDFSNSDIIFNSKFDLQLACYMHAFKEAKSLTYKRSRDSIALSREFKSNISFFQKLKAFCLSIYTNSRVAMIRRENRLCEVIDIEKYKLKIIDFEIDQNLYDRYSIQLTQDVNNAVIFFAEPFQDSFQTKEEYDFLNVEVVKHLKKLNYTVFVKGHPRKGIHPQAREMANNIVPNYIPSEFIDLSCFKFAVNFFSVALCSASFKIPAYSLIGMYEIRDFDTYNYWKQYINETSNSQVIIISSFDELPHPQNKIF